MFIEWKKGKREVKYKLKKIYKNSVSRSNICKIPLKLYVSFEG